MGVRPSVRTIEVISFNHPKDSHIALGPPIAPITYGPTEKMADGYSNGLGTMLGRWLRIYTTVAAVTIGVKVTSMSASW